MPPLQFRARLMARLRSAGGELLRNQLREGIRSGLPAAEFDRLVAPMIERGEVAREDVRRKFSFAGQTIERACTVYRLVDQTTNQTRGEMR